MSAFSCLLLHFMLLCCCICLSMTSSAANVLGNETDRVALLAFKSQITLDPLNVTSSWNDSQHFCDWEGVTCSQRHQRVTILNLGSKGLVGSISPHVGNLSFLRTIVLENNTFQGEIPQEVGYLLRLEHLVAANTSLVGKIPVNISRCSNLRNLSLSFNNLVGKIPTELGSLSKLSLLSLDFNKLTGGIPPSLGNLTSLQILSMTGNNFGGNIPNNIHQLKRLKFLSLNSCKLSGGIPTSLGNLTSLQTLSMSKNNFGGNIPDIIHQWKRLKFLSLGLCKLSGRVPPSLYNISTLEVVSITDNQLSGNLPIDIGLMLPNIKTLYFGGNKFSGQIPNSLSNASKLQEIDIDANQFTGKVPLNLGNLKDLRHLLLGKNHLGSRKSGDLDFFTSLTNCSNLVDLQIDRNQFGGVLPASVANLSNQLYQMLLDDNQISGNIPTEIDKFQNMIFLDMSENLFTGSIPASIGNLQNLGILDLSDNLLSGQIPSSLGNMSQLYILDMGNNLLEGNISSCLDNKILQFVYLSYNNFTGIIPKEIGLSSRLLAFSLTNNSLSGSLPMEMGNLKNLAYLNVANNKLCGEIPNTLASCSTLEHLHLQGNFFNGSIPSFLSSLRGLQDLDLSRNNFSGNFPQELDKLPFLEYLNLSFNNIEGEVPIEGRIFRNASVFSVFGNHKLCGGIPKLGLPNCHVQKSKKTRVLLALMLSLGVLIVSVMLAFFFVIYSRKPNAKPLTEEFPRDLRRVSYNDLHKATDGFSSENLIGMGSYGSVYKGLLRQDEGPIAVKVLNLMERGASKSFVAECEALRIVRHRNLLKILTVCSSTDFNGNDFKALVYEFMPDGSLENWLHPSSDGHLPRCLSISQRLNIAIDVASALDYLHNHCERPIVHCDLKSNNVLLSDDMTALVCDFGLAKFLSMSTSSSNKNETSSLVVRGTIGYIPPEYSMGGEVSTQGDVYSYGILLQEMFTGKRPTDEMFKDGLCLHEFSKMALPERVMDIIDIRLLSEETRDVHQKKECLNSIIRIGVACSVELVSKRMEIKDVLNKLHSIKEDLQI